jgi:transcriptional regulator with XRE-family HTH domain
MTFAEKLRELRDSKGLSEVKLAEASGVAFGALHFYALGRRKPSFAAVVKLSRALGVSCEAFADCEDVTGEDAETDSTEPKRSRSGKAPPSGWGEAEQPKKGKKPRKGESSN